MFLFYFILFLDEHAMVLRYTAKGTLYASLPKSQNHHFLYFWGLCIILYIICVKKKKIHFACDINDQITMYVVPSKAPQLLILIQIYDNIKVSTNSKFSALEEWVNVFWIEDSP